MPPKRFYCYVDETGQDTKGKFFLVTVVLKEQAHLAPFLAKLEKLEKATKKNLLKWTKTSFVVRKNYLRQLATITELSGAIFYSTYHETKEYTPLISLTIAKAVLAEKEDNYTVTIIIDGLKKKEMEEVRKELKKLKIHYRKIRGMKDEQSVFLRLADAIAGFLRDYIEKQPYAKMLLKKFKEAKILTEV